MKKYAGFTPVTVLGLIIVGIFVALEFTGMINFIDYQPQNTIESNPENYPGDAVFLNYCLDNNIIRGEEGLKCAEVVGNRVKEIVGGDSIASTSGDLSPEQLQERIDENRKKIQELDRLLAYLKRASVG